MTKNIEYDIFLIVMSRCKLFLMMKEKQKPEFRLNHLLIHIFVEMVKYTKTMKIV